MKAAFAVSAIAKAHLQVFESSAGCGVHCRQPYARVPIECRWSISAAANGAPVSDHMLHQIQGVANQQEHCVTIHASCVTFGVP